MHDYYKYSPEELLLNTKVPMELMESSQAVFSRMAADMTEEIIRNNEAGKRTVFICPVGPVGQYPYFVDLVNKKKISLKNVWFFNMDEYLTDDGKWIERETSLSCGWFMNRGVYAKIDSDLLMPECQRVFPDPLDPEKQPRLLEELGGADICFGGIGINGHLAFNEPQPEMSAEEFAQLSTRVLSITPETRTANAIGDLDGAIEDMPKMAVSIGIREILASRKIRIGVFRTWHRAVLRRTGCGELTAAFPATLLQKHPDAIVYANNIASEAAIK